MKYKDKRLKVMNEILSGMKVRIQMGEEWLKGGEENGEKRRTKI